jgi:hypothetical protein
MRYCSSGLRTMTMTTRGYCKEPVQHLQLVVARQLQADMTLGTYLNYARHYILHSTSSLMCVMSTSAPAEIAFAATVTVHTDSAAQTLRLHLHSLAQAPQCIASSHKHAALCRLRAINIYAHCMRQLTLLQQV